MMSTVFLTLLNIIVIKCQITCKQEYGNIANNGSISFSDCSGNYTLVSCGLNSTDVNGFSGTRITNNECAAFSVAARATVDVISVANCCNLTPYIEYNSNICETYISDNNSDSSTQHTSIATCADSGGTTTLFGCSYYFLNYGTGANGACTTNNINDLSNICEVKTDNFNAEYCIGVNNAANDDSLFAEAQCCGTPNVSTTCHTVWSQPGFPVASVSCPSDYFMSGCSGYLKNWGHQKIMGYYVLDGKCIVTASQVNNDEIYAVGICCKFGASNTQESQTNTTTLFIVVGAIFLIISGIVIFFVVKTCCDARETKFNSEVKLEENMKSNNINYSNNTDLPSGVFPNNDVNSNITPGIINKNKDAKARNVINNNDNNNDDSVLNMFHVTNHHPTPKDKYIHQLGLTPKGNKHKGHKTGIIQDSKGNMFTPDGMMKDNSGHIYTPDGILNDEGGGSNKINIMQYN